MHTQLASDVAQAAKAGVNTMRLYGFGIPFPAGVLDVFRNAFTQHDIRVLYTLPCYKDTQQKTSQGMDTCRFCTLACCLPLCVLVLPPVCTRDKNAFILHMYSLKVYCLLTYVEQLWYPPRV